MINFLFLGDFRANQLTSFYMKGTLAFNELTKKKYYGLLGLVEPL